MLHKLHACLHSTESWETACRPNPIPVELTGASDWIDCTALHIYEQEHGPEALRWEVIPFASRERWVDFNSPHSPVQAHPLEPITEVSTPRGLLHLAFLTRGKVEELGHDRYVAANRAITPRVAELLQAWPAMPVVTTYSGAAAALNGQPLDLAGNPYATLKQEEEALLERQSATRMALVFRVYAALGRFMTRPEKFALGDFLLQAMAGRAIVIRSRRKAVRSYVPVGTLMKLAWRLLHSSLPPGSHRIEACKTSISLRDLAVTISKRFGLSASLHAVDPPHLPSSDYTADPCNFCSWLAGMDIIEDTLIERIEATAAGLTHSNGAAK